VPQPTDGLSEEARRIWEVLEHHVGRDNAIPGRVLAATVDVPYRKLARIIRYYRRKGALPGRVRAQRGLGYFVAFDEDGPGPGRRPEAPWRPSGEEVAPAATGEFSVTVRGPGVTVTRRVCEETAVRAVGLVVEDAG